MKERTKLWEFKTGHSVSLQLNHFKHLQVRRRSRINDHMLIVINSQHVRVLCDKNKLLGQQVDFGAESGQVSRDLVPVWARRCRLGVEEEQTEPNKVSVANAARFGPLQSTATCWLL